MSECIDRKTSVELYPIKLVGGFIALDQFVGCIGCKFCLSRRHPFWRKAFTEHLEYTGPFDDPLEALSLLEQMKPFTKARVPLRFGHNTDALFQWEFGVRLYKRLPEENPFIFMTRFPLDEKRVKLFQGQPNLLLKQTITPNSLSLQMKTDVKGILEWVHRIPATNIFFLIGPLVTDNVQGARELIDLLPKGAWIDIKPLTKKGIPGIEHINVPSEAEIEILRKAARKRDMTVTDYFGCRFRIPLKRPFYKAYDAPGYVKIVCDTCENNIRCFGKKDQQAIESAIRKEAADIGIELKASSWIGPGTTLFNCEISASRGDETYLSEIFNHRVLLSSVPDGSQGGSFCLEDEAVHARWEQYGMFPTSSVAKLVQKILNNLP